MKNDNSNYLTTHEEWDLAGQLEAIKSDAIPACLIRISPKNSRTGLNEESGEWILKFWENVTKNEKKVEGHRIGWSDIVLFAQSMNEKEFQEFIRNLLKSLTVSNLKSLALFSLIHGEVEGKIKEIDRMYLQLSKLDYWTEHIYSVYYEDGIEIELAST